MPRSMHDSNENLENYRLMREVLTQAGACAAGGFAAALSAAAAPPSPSAGWDAFAGRPPLFTAPELLPTQSSRRRVPSSQAAKMLLISGCCLQSPCLPGRRPQDRRPFNFSNDSFIEYPSPTVVSYRRESLSTCKYPEIFTRSSSGTS